MLQKQEMELLLSLSSPDDKAEGPKGARGTLQKSSEEGSLKTRLMKGQAAKHMVVS